MANQSRPAAQQPRRPAQPPTLADCVTDAIDGLMALEQRMRLGHPTHAGVEDNVDDIRRLAGKLLDAVHGRHGRPVHRVWVSADGRTAGG